MSTNTSFQQEPLVAIAPGPHHRHNPSLSVLSETSSASSSTHRLPSFPSYADPKSKAEHEYFDFDPIDPIDHIQHHFDSPSVTPVVSNSRNTKGLSINGPRTTITGTVPVPVPVQAAIQPIRRKPLSKTASPIATRYSSGDYLATVVKSLPKPEQRYDRAYSVDSPTVYDFPQAQVEHMSRLPRWDSTTKTNPIIGASYMLPTHHNNQNNHNNYNKEKYHESHHPLASASGNSGSAVIAAEGTSPRPRDSNSNPATLQTKPASYTSHPDEHEPTTLYDDLLVDEDEDHLSHNILDDYNSDLSDNTPSPINSNHNMSLPVSRKHVPQHLTLKSDVATLVRTNSNDIKSPNIDKPLPKSPGSSRLGTFFGWASSPPATEPSERTFSPLPSPYNFSKSGSITDASPITTVGPQSSIEASKSQFDSPNSRDYCDTYLATPLAASPHLADIDEMEDELKAISAELAMSIRREMDLEDLVDRLQTEKDNPATTGNKRTSDYFSDSGYSSAKFSEYDQSKEEIEKIQRRSEQEKAQLRLELTTKLQDERQKRQKMDEQIRDLSTKASQMDHSTMGDADTSDRVKELEATCETLRRKLSEERKVKDNFEDLLSALKGELQNASNERDNLRDEILPQLRARVDGLENQASELEKMTYDSTKMQQELQNLRNENTNLKQVQMNSIIEEGDTISAPLSRSNSVGGSRSSFRLQRPPSGLMRSKSVKPSESRDQLSERLKDVEEQRDALHRALKNLLERQEHQNRENQKKIRALEMERERLLTSSPQKAGFQREITNLRAEINVLRRRAEEALDQKWQVEKGLAGLKMDLDRAEQEVAYLRELLDEKDILIPPGFARSSSGSDQFAGPVTSESLLGTYQDLQTAYADSLRRIKSLEVTGDEKTRAAMAKLEEALSKAITDRDIAQHEAESYKKQLETLRAGEQAYLESEKALADELQESARRVEELAIQVRQQLSTNQQLRQRIADTVARGDASQKANVEQITSMQARLRSLEEKLDAAQAASEDRVARHEEEMSALKESHNDQLTRLSSSLRSPRIFPGKSPLSPLFTSPGAPSPRLSVTRSGPAMNASEETQVDNLKARVAELENALMDTDAAMQQVVGRMNTAQIEVLQLQEERESAINQTRKLERVLQAEKVKAFEGRFKTLQS